MNLYWNLVFGPVDGIENLAQFMGLSFFFLLLAVSSSFFLPREFGLVFVQFIWNLVWCCFGICPVHGIGNLRWYAQFVGLEIWFGIGLDSFGLVGIWSMLFGLVDSSFLFGASSVVRVLGVLGTICWSHELQLVDSFTKLLLVNRWFVSFLANSRYFLQ